MIRWCSQGLESELNFGMIEMYYRNEMKHSLYSVLLVIGYVGDSLKCTIGAIRSKFTIETALENVIYMWKEKTTTQIHDFTIMKFATDKENVGGFARWISLQYLKLNINLWRKVVCFVLYSQDPPYWDASDCVLGLFRNLISTHQTHFLRFKIVMQSWRRLWFYRWMNPSLILPTSPTWFFFLKGEEKYHPQTNERKVGFITLTLIQINQICNKPIQNVVFSHIHNKLLELKYQVCSWAHEQKT
jgi:hypothetical protein